MSEDLATILAHFRTDARSEREKGDYFEQIVAAYLRHDALQAQHFSEVQTFADWARAQGKDARDTGIDLVATLRDGTGFCAVQCKFYSPGHRIEKKDIDSFFTASGKAGFVRRLVVDVSDGNWSSHAENALADQSIPTQRIGLSDLEASDIEWATFAQSGELRTSAKRALRPDQAEALAAVRDGLAKADRGKLIMACGTGKTFTALRIAEAMVGAGGTVLFMVPSLALMSQAVRDWTNDAALPLRSFAVCSDVKVGKRQGREDTADIAIHDLAYPATTNGARFAEQLGQLAPEVMTVVFATYQSINVLTEAQAAGVGAFDLIVCDEAHRTTGVRLGDEDDSAFVRIHDDANVAGLKRLYMTATPRIYGEAVKKQSEERSITLCAMDDPAIYGEVLFERGFSWAVEAGLLTDYKVVVLAMDEDHVARSVQRRLSEDNELRLDDATKIIGCYKALSKTGLASDLGGDAAPMRRALAFCKDIRSSKLIEAEFAKVVENHLEQEVKEGGTTGLSCEVRHVDGTFNAESRTRLLDWLKRGGGEDTCRILSNARCLSEGVDVPALDAILFLHPRKSQIDVVQSVGRVMRRAEGKRMGYVILPIGIPPGQTPEQALNANERYRVVWQILNALRAHDERLDGTINQMSLGQDVSTRIEVIAVANKLPGEKSPVEPGIDIGSGSASGDEEEDGLTSPSADGQSRLFVDEFAAAVRARIVKKCGTRDYWEDWAANVAEIAQKHITRIQVLIEDGDVGLRATFEEFLADLRSNLNDSITQEDAIEMLAQHSITRPVFETLFEGHSFVSENPVSRAMQDILDRLDAARIEKEAEELEKFYASVRRRAQGITDPAAKQQLIVQLYDRFFYRAFPRTTKRMGVVYTPVEIIDFILASVDETLRREFGQTLGSEGVHVIDPFTGTGTFVTRLLQSGLIAPEDLERKYRQEIHANEIILLAYYIAAINIETAYQGLAGGDAYLPFEGICLTDTFQMHEPGDLVDRIMPDNSERRARQRGLDIRVIIGNPPYVVGEDDANSDDAKVSYPKLDGRIRNTYAARTDARNVNGLYNSYLRAIRWASDRLGENGGVVAFVTNGGFLDGNASAGVRRCLVEEFSDLRILDLRGNQRTSGERSRREGGKIFDAGSRAPIAISILTKNPTKEAAGAIHYHDIGDYLSRGQKLSMIREFSSIDGIERVGGWAKVVPDEHGDWINQRDASFDAFIRIGQKGSTSALFATYSNGVKTQRDPWVVNASRRELERNVTRLLDAYQESVERIKVAGATDNQAKLLRNNDSRQIAWTSGLHTDAEQHKLLTFDASQCVVATYRPFTPQWLYFDRRLNERVYRIPSMFPTPEFRTRAICLSAAGHKGQFSALMVDRVPSLHTGDMAGSQCFPLRFFGQPEADEDDHHGDLIDAAPAPEWQEHDGITDAGLAHFQAAYPGQTVSKEDVFYYVYGILHSPDYRALYGDNLKKELPRIPAVATFEDFAAFAAAGRELADLHVGFEQVEPYSATYEQGDLRLARIDDPVQFYRVKRMRFGGKRGAEDRSRIVYNANVTLTDVPREAYRYVVNGKSGIEHVMERQGVSTDAYDPGKRTGSGIENDANRYAVETIGDPAYPLLLLRRVITVSLETVRIVDSLPPLHVAPTVEREAGH